MFKSTRHLLIGASVLALAVPAFAQKSKTRVKKEELKKEVEKSAFSGSFGIVVGSDSNILDTKNGTGGSFFEFKPALNYTKGVLSADLSAGIKDFGDQAISSNAKENNASLGFGINATIFGETKSATKLTLGYEDVRLPNYFASDDNEVFNGNGMPHRTTTTGISQNLNWEYDRLSLGLAAAHEIVDYSTDFSGFEGDIFGAQEFELDYSETTGSATVGIKFHKNLTLSSTPLVGFKKYDNRPARSSSGQRLGEAGNGRLTEYLNNELKTELKFSIGGFALTPHITSGIQIDQANGGEDYRFTDAGLATEVLVNKDNNVKLTASVGTNNKDYDNWTYNLTEAGKRKDDTVTSAVGAAFDINKSLSVNVDYSNEEVESTYDSVDYNMRREIFSTGLTVKF